MEKFFSIKLMKIREENDALHFHQNEADENILVYVETELLH